MGILTGKSRKKKPGGEICGTKKRITAPVQPSVRRLTLPPRDTGGAPCRGGKNGHCVCFSCRCVCLNGRCDRICPRGERSRGCSYCCFFVTFSNELLAFLKQVQLWMDIFMCKLDFFTIKSKKSFGLFVYLKGCG